MFEYYLLVMRTMKPIVVIPRSHFKIWLIYWLLILKQGELFTTIVATDNINSWCYFKILVSYWLAWIYYTFIPIILLTRFFFYFATMMNIWKITYRYHKIALNLMLRKMHVAKFSGNDEFNGILQAITALRSQKNSVCHKIFLSIKID